jgi:UPF0755 protein
MWRVLKRRPIFCAVMVVVAVGMAGAAVVYMDYKQASRAMVVERGETKRVEIPSGTAWPGVVDRLVDAGIIDNRWYFEAWARRRGLPNEAKAGDYELTGPVGWWELADRLEEGGIEKGVKVTIPEGWTIFHIAERLDRLGLVESTDFLEQARSNSLIEELALSGQTVEGFLFPDTYRFDESAGANKIIRRMVGRWREVWRKIAAQHPSELDAIKEAYKFDRHDLVTLASLVEAESPVIEERSIIARVFYNRLDAGMRLQTDPTCVYGEETYLQEPSPASCKDPTNRYSTYVNDGLPPGPIGNPSRTSLEAAVDPSDSEEAGGYLYFVARQDGSGRHVFSNTYRQHRRAVQKHLK